MVFFVMRHDKLYDVSFFLCCAPAHYEKYHVNSGVHQCITKNERIYIPI